MKKYYILIWVLSFLSLAAMAQESADEVRTQSGVDPTRVTSRASYSFLFYDKQDDNVQINNRLAANFGVNRWSFALKADFVSVNNTASQSFASGFGDLKFTILNAFYVKGKNALAGSVEFGLPTASSNIAQASGSGGYFMATPAITWSYTINPGLMVAVQPQYTFALAKKQGYPNISTLTTRMFLAKFFKSGLFFVFEPRPIYDFNNNQFDLVISPILGKALGKGFNFILLAEIPTNSDILKSRGVLYQCGFSKTF